MFKCDCEWNKLGDFDCIYPDCSKAKSRDIPADKINEAVARAQGWELRTDKYSNEQVWVNEETLTIIISKHLYVPTSNHNQFHEIWTADIEAKACDVLQEWFTVYPDNDDSIVEYWHDSRYQANPRLWQLRAYCEAMGNEG